MRDGAQNDSGELIKRLDNNVLNYYLVPENPRYFRTTPRNFLSSNRLDIVSRYLLVKHVGLGWGVGWATDQYRDLLFHSNRQFFDGDGRKSSFADYLSNFMGLIRDAYNGNFNYDHVVIPFVGDTIVDGAHRFAIALHFNCPVNFIELDGPIQKMDWHGLRELGLRESATEHLLQEYMGLDENSYCAVFFSQPESRLEESRRAISESSTLIYEKTIVLSEVGRLNLMRLLYGHEPWWDDSKAMEFVKLRMPNSGKVNFIFFAPNQKQGGSRPVKELIRKNLPAEHCVHTNDTHKETKWIADIVLSVGGLKYLNSSFFEKPDNFQRLYEPYSRIINYRADRDEFALDSGAVLAAHGIRDCGDFDYISAKGQELTLDEVSNLDIACHNDEYSTKFNSIERLIADPDFYFRWKGIKFLSLYAVLLLKSIRGAKKDIADAQQIIAFKPKMTLREIYDKKKIELNAFRRNWLPMQINKIILKVKDYLPVPLYKFLRWFWRRYFCRIQP